MTFYYQSRVQLQEHLLAFIFLSEKEHSEKCYMDLCLQEYNGLPPNSMNELQTLFLNINNFSFSAKCCVRVRMF